MTNVRPVRIKNVAIYDGNGKEYVVIAGRKGDILEDLEKASEIDAINKEREENE